MWSTLGGLRIEALETLEADGGCRDSNSEACGGDEQPSTSGSMAVRVWDLLAG